MEIVKILYSQLAVKKLLGKTEFVRDWVLRYLGNIEASLFRDLFIEKIDTPFFWLLF